LATKPQIKTLRAHIVAALLVDARLYARRTPEEACALLGWDTRHLEALETAAITASLPELEALAAIYAVPVDHFFGSSSLSDGMPKLRVETMQQRLELRNRIIGAMIMQTRSRRNLSRDDLAILTDLSLEEVAAYELGQISLPVTDLEEITRILQIDIADWIDSYAIPSREMVFKPMRLETTSTPQEPEAQQVPTAAPLPEPEKSNAQPVQTQQLMAAAAIVEKQSQPTVSESAPVQDQKAPTDAKALTTDEIGFLLDNNLPKELVDFISNPINKQYLILASNLSHMPADQLRRIAESLLEITF
jgi:transcriptional regulator with XRE-family HTH domain